MDEINAWEEVIPPGAGERRHAGANKVRETRPIWHGLGGIGSELEHEAIATL